MGTHHGNEGVVKIGSNAVAEVDNWTLTETQEVADDSAMGDTWRTHITGKKAWNGQLTCHWDETDATGQGALTIGASVTLNLYPEGDGNGDVYFTGTATVTEISRPVTQDGVTNVTFSFQGNGALSQTTVGA